MSVVSPDIDSFLNSPNKAVARTRLGVAPSSPATTTTPGLMTPDMVIKLDGIEEGATANATDASLRDRSLQTGVMPLSALGSGGAAVGDSVVWNGTAYEPYPVAPEADPIGYFANLMAENTPVSVYWMGDSTYWGYLDGGAQASPTPVATAQAVWRSYYNNTGATCVNLGVSSTGTTYGLSILASTLAGMPTNSILGIAYGTNDATGLVPSETKTAAAYADDLRTMARMVRAAGKSCFFETPLPLFPFGTLGNQIRAERVKQFAETMRLVAKELSIPLLDTYAFFRGTLDSLATPATLFSDGIHMTQVGYNMRGRWMANLFMRGAVMPADGVIKSIDPSIRQYEGTNSTLASPGSATGYGRIGRKIRIPLEVREAGTDLFLATPIWSAGTASFTVALNGVTVVTGSLQAAALTPTGFAVDHEIMIAENIAPGMYLVEFDCAAGDVGLYYVLARPTRAIVVQSTISPALTRSRNVGDLRMTSDASPKQNSLSDITVSTTLREFSVSFTATLDNFQGIILHGTRRSNGVSQPRGLLFFLDTDGFLTAGTGEEDTYALTVLGAVDLTAVSHDYRFTLKVNGDVDCYVDDVLIDTYTPTVPYRGGRIGAYTFGVSSTVLLSSVTIS